MRIDLLEKNKIKFTRRELLIAFSAALIIAVSLIFPQATLGESFWLSFFLFAVFPVGIIRFLLKEPFENFGFSWKKSWRGAALSLVIILIFVSANYYLVFHSAVANHLPVVRSITAGFLSFLLFEIFLSLPLHFFSEIFFRGFLQMGLEKKLGLFSLVAATILQTAPFLRGNWVVISLIFFSSLAAGLIVRQSRSVIYSTLSMWIISVSLDIMIVKVINQGGF